MKQKIFGLCLTAFLIASCKGPASETSMPQFETPVIVPTSTTSTGGVVTLNNISFTIPLGVARDAQSEMVSAVTDDNTPFWEVAPAHSKFTLTGYQVQDKAIPPQIFVYPADDYAKVNSNAAAEIQRLKDVLAGGALNRDTIPHWLVNAGQIFAAKPLIIPFQNGRGLRILTQYDQYPAPVNNRELIYQFQGLTNDGKYLVVAILPVSASILAEDEKPEAAVPAGGIPLPASGGPDQAYYDNVTKALDAMYEDSFNPSLFQLDALIQSIQVTP